MVWLIDKVPQTFVKDLLCITFLETICKTFQVRQSIFYLQVTLKAIEF